MIGRIALASTLLLAGGCTKTVYKDRFINTETAIPVGSPCVPSNLGTEPTYPDTDEALRVAADAAERYQLTAAGRKLRIARLNELEPVVAGCPRK